MTDRLGGLLLLALASLPMGAPRAEGDASRSPASDVPAPGTIRVELPREQADGARIARVFVDLVGSAGDADADQAVRRRIDALLTLRAGDAYRSADAGLIEAGVRAVAGVADARLRLFASSEPGSLVLVVSATLGAPSRPARTGAFPVLSESERHLLRLQLSGGMGLFHDHNPWFASAPAFTAQSPIAEAPPGPGWTSWGEASVEHGLAGAVRLGDAPATAFAEVTAVASGSAGADLFRDDTRWRNRFEKAYAGLAWTDRALGRSLRVSSGRQNWQLYGGFLFSRFAAGANAGPHPGLYLSPRTTYERAHLLDARWGDLRFEAFSLDPAELDAFDSGSRFNGFNLRYVREGRWEAGVTRYGVPSSRSNVALAGGGGTPRQGQRTEAVRLGLTGTGAFAGVELLGEYARQEHVRVDWDAEAWYAQARYRFDDAPWRPNVTWRVARFSGDDPSTPAQEAFDAPLSSGLDEWVQGVSFKKVVTNSNLDTQRIRLNAGPDARLDFTLDLFRLHAHQPLPSGADHYGDEVNLGVRWAISPRLFFLGVAGVAWPGDVLRERTQGRERPWATVQASLFWGF